MLPAVIGISMLVGSVSLAVLASASVNKAYNDFEDNIKELDKFENE